MELINEIRFEDETEFFNDLTREMDRHLKPSSRMLLEHIGDGTYICSKFRGVYPIRFPGSTRGHISLDESNCITGVHLYDTACGDCVGVYEQSVNDIFEKYIGAKIIDYCNENHNRGGVVLCAGTGRAVMSSIDYVIQPSIAKELAELTLLAAPFGINILPNMSNAGRCTRDTDGKCSYFKRPCNRKASCKKYLGA